MWNDLNEKIVMVAEWDDAEVEKILNKIIKSKNG